jgi:hypothetical protein
MMIIKTRDTRSQVMPFLFYMLLCKNDVYMRFPWVGTRLGRNTGVSVGETHVYAGGQHQNATPGTHKTTIDCEGYYRP